MNQREKMLAIVVGSLALVFLLWYSIPRIIGSYSERTENISRLEREIKTKDRARLELRRNQRTLDKLKEQSLSADPDLAQSQYKDWLINTIIKDVKLDNVDVVSGAIQKNGDLYLQHSFKVMGKGDLQQLTKFLFHFYRANYLHRIRQLSIIPIPQRKNQLQLTFTIDAMSLQSVARDKELSKETSENLAEDNVEKYLATIVQRNLFGRGNEYGPRFSRRTGESIEVNKSKTFRLSASDSDGIARYQIVKHDLPEEESTIEWDPAGNVTIMSKKVGDFTLEVRATDKGLPAKTSEIAKISIRIREPPPPEEVKVVAAKFDFANTAFWIASVDEGGKPEAWVRRREQGITLHLHVGDTVDIGSIKGKIVRISPRELELAEGNERLTIQLGKALSSASFRVENEKSE